MKIIRASDYIPKLWKNGQGTTQEIFLHPSYRLSMAELKESGPFSLFPDRDRILVVLEGAPITLKQNERIHELDLHVPYSFDGACETWATISVPGRDFNLMTEKGKVVGRIRVETLSQEWVLEKKSDSLFIFMLMGELSIDDQKLSRYETAILTQDSRVKPIGATGKFLVIEIDELRIPKYQRT